MTLRIDGLRVRYPGRKEPSLDGVALEVGPGEIVGVTGPTGGGKSTLCLAAVGFVPRVVRASVEGSVLVGDTDALKAQAVDLAGTAGIVFSSPGIQLSASKTSVREELAFGLENLAVARAEMDTRIDAVLERLGIAHLADREPLSLSGGEQQRVAIASILVMGTQLLVLDEPTAQLDPQGTRDIADLLTELAHGGRAVLVAEHARSVLDRAQRQVVLEHGRSVPEITPPRDGPTVAVPSVRGADPVTVAVRDISFSYGSIDAIRGVSLTFQPRERVAIVGQNGSGKTTLVKHLNGLLKPLSGTVEVAGGDIRDRAVSDVAASIGFVFQNPDDQLFHGRVDQEIGFGPRNLGLAAGDVERLVDISLQLVGLTDERATNPYDLGFSLRKLVALGSVVAMEPPVLVLDEPTTGQDGAGVSRIGAIVDGWAEAGRTVIAITHDMEFAARHFSRIVVMRGGQVMLDGPPTEIFARTNSAALSSTGLVAPPFG